MPNGEWDKNIVSFGVDNSFSMHDDNPVDYIIIDVVDIIIIDIIDIIIDIQK